MTEPRRDAVASIFMHIDRDGDGTFGTDDLALVLRSLDEDAWSDELLSTLFQAMDTNQDGRIHRKEFVDWVFGAGSRAVREADADTLLVHQNFREALAALPVAPLAPSLSRRSSSKFNVDDNRDDMDLLLQPSLARERSSGDRALLARNAAKPPPDLDEALTELRQGNLSAALRFLGEDDVQMIQVMLELGDVEGAVGAIKTGIMSVMILESARAAEASIESADSGAPSLGQEVTATRASGLPSGQVDLVTRCPRGHLLKSRGSKVWDWCDKCGWRPVLGWCGGMERYAYACCMQCDYHLCGECSGLAATNASPSSQEMAAQLALAKLLQLCEEVREDTSLKVHGMKFALPSQDLETGGEIYAFVIGPVVRQIIGQGELCVCGACATAAALNACTEQLPIRKQRLQLTWKNVLYGHFRDKLKISVKDEDGDPASWKVGKPHIKQVIESFPCMRTRDLITAQEAELKNRAAAWKSLVTEMRRPNTTLFYHTKSVDGHYTLIAGIVGPARSESVDDMPYDPQHSAILTNQIGQEPIQRVLFERTCELIRKNKGFFRIFVVEYRK